MNTTRAQAVNNHEILPTPSYSTFTLQKPPRKKIDSESEDVDYLDLNSFATKKAASAGY